MKLTIKQLKQLIKEQVEEEADKIDKIDKYERLRKDLSDEAGVPYAPKKNRKPPEGQFGRWAASIEKELDEGASPYGRQGDFDTQDSLRKAEGDRASATLDRRYKDVQAVGGRENQAANNARSATYAKQDEESRARSESEAKRYQTNKKSTGATLAAESVIDNLSIDNAVKSTIIQLINKKQKVSEQSIKASLPKFSFKEPNGLNLLTVSINNIINAVVAQDIKKITYVSQQLAQSWPAIENKGVMGKVKGFFGMKEQAALKEMIRAEIKALKK